MDYFFELFLGGLTRGSIYALIALGYTMVYGIIELINFAHGEIYMIGAFTALIAASLLTMAGFKGLAVLALAMVIAVIYAGAYGYKVEKVAYQPLRQAPRLSPLISAIGMSIFLQNYVLLAQTSDFLPFPSLIPQFRFMASIEHIFSSSELVIVTVTATAMILLTCLIKFTRMGKAIRAAAHGEKPAVAMPTGTETTASAAAKPLNMPARDRLEGEDKLVITNALFLQQVEHARPVDPDPHSPRLSAAILDVADRGA